MTDRPDFHSRVPIYDIKFSVLVPAPPLGSENLAVDEAIYRAIYMLKRMSDEELFNMVQADFGEADYWGEYADMIEEESRYPQNWIMEWKDVGQGWSKSEQEGHWRSHYAFAIRGCWRIERA